MYLRELKEKDAPLMLEWMHDESVVKDLQTNFATKTLEDCLGFIRNSIHSATDAHFAIANDADEYMGTVSLKHIENDTAEFAITIRACAMGKGFSAFGMKRILEKGLLEMGLKEIYWCVSPDNKRAVRFYDKHGYRRVGVQTLTPQGYTQEQQNYFIWYTLTKEDCKP